ncbi:MAG: hypothetical protein QOH95_640 [Gaiellaceae bacterium]|nr:hypothetical protein [Gaiellaceae bacterium]
MEHGVHNRPLSSRTAQRRARTDENAGEPRGVPGAGAAGRRAGRATFARVSPREEGAMNAIHGSGNTTLAQAR